MPGCRRRGDATRRGGGDAQRNGTPAPRQRLLLAGDASCPLRVIAEQRRMWLEPLVRRRKDEGMSASSAEALIWPGRSVPFSSSTYTPEACARAAAAGQQGAEDYRLRKLAATLQPGTNLAHTCKSHAQSILELVDFTFLWVLMGAENESVIQMGIVILQE